jgi:hypothetical protein
MITYSTVLSGPVCNTRDPDLYPKMIEKSYHINNLYKKG